MTTISKFLPLTNVVLNLEVSSKKRAFEQAGLLFENNCGIARSIVSENLFAQQIHGIAGTWQRQGLVQIHGIAEKVAL